MTDKINAECKQKEEIEIVSFKCRGCLCHCDVGDAIMKVWDEHERQVYNKKITEDIEHADKKK